MRAMRRPLIAMGGKFDDVIESGSVANQAASA
jgi:hypothetical protein